MRQALRDCLTGSLLIALVSSACIDSPDKDTVEVLGDTIVVRSVQAGLWGESRMLREDLRIGSVEGPVELCFGEVLELAPTPEGGVIIFDGFSMKVSLFSNQGDFLGYVGRYGQGPGEFGSVWGLAVLPSGEILIRTRQNKILVFSRAREYIEEWSVPRSIAPPGALVVLQDGQLVVKALWKYASDLEPAVYGFQSFSPRGEVLDSAGPLTTPWDGENEWKQNSRYFPNKYAEWSPQDFGVAAVSSRLAFQVFERNGSIVRVERGSERPRFVPGERREHNAQQEFLGRRNRDPSRFPSVPERKPVFDRVILSRTGEIYFHLRTEAVGPNPSRVPEIMGLPTTPDWLEPLVLEAFDRTGRYLGRVEGPPGVTPRLVSGDTLWGLTQGSLGETYVVRFIF